MKNKHFWDSIQKYGWDNFSHEILFSGLSPEEAFRKERELIAEYDSQNYRRGYNCSSGGEGGLTGCFGEKHPMYGKHHSTETRARLSAAKRGVPYSQERYDRFLETIDKDEMRRRAYQTIVGYNKGKPHSEERKRKIAESNRGQTRSEETKQKISEKRKIPVMQFSKDGVFVRSWESAKQVAEMLPVQASHISRVCKKQRKTAGGFIWRYNDDKEEQLWR